MGYCTIWGNCYDSGLVKAEPLDLARRYAKVRGTRPNGSLHHDQGDQWFGDTDHTDQADLDQ